MYIVDGVIVSSEVFSHRFHCHLSKCKGACCWEGDYGAPVERAEETVLDDILPHIASYLSEASIEVISNGGTSVHTSYTTKKVTPLHEDGACVYLVKDDQGIAHCGIEKAWADGKISFKKPISCHLYPIRITKNEATGYEALNYDEWDICSAACTLGAEKDIPVFRFVKDALIRRYGEEFYVQLEDIYNTYFRKG